jgi:hypothetical protein
MTSLAELQRNFQRHVMHADDAIASAIADSARVPVATRLGIYSEAYRLRLTEALASTLPRMQELLGDDQFATLASRYIDECPSTFPSIRWFGDRLPQYLAQWYPEQPWLTEIAQWEWSLATAFDAADATPLGIEALASVMPDAWPTLAFSFHPSLQLLRMRTNAPTLCKALIEEQAPPEPELLDRPQPWLVWRQSFKTQYRSLTEDEADALQTMQGGATFADLCDTLARWHEADAVPMQAAGTLKRWLVDGMIVRVVSEP